VKQLQLTSTPLEYNKVWTTTVQVRVPEGLSPTRPRWRRHSIAEPFYEVVESRPNNGVAELQGSVVLSVNGLETGFWRPLQTRYHHPEYGELKQSLKVVPRISVAFENANAIIVRGQRQHVVNVRVRNGAIDGSEGKLALELPAGWRSEPVEQLFSLTRADEAISLRFRIQVPETFGDVPVTIKAVAICAGQKYTEGYEEVTARDLGRAHYFRPAEQRLRSVDVTIPKGLNVGYVMGAGDEIPAALAQLGVAVTLLDNAELEKGDLSRFDTVMIGIRAYAVRADLIAANPRLLDYVHGGGTLVVHYQTPEFDRNYGPFPYTMSRNPEEVSEEDAKVTILRPDHPLMTSPNRISEKDFDGWFEQRGSKFLQSWDDRYEPLLECHDQEQPQQLGGLLYARHGKGAYIYSAYALYRQLPLGTPGAYRLLANLVAFEP